MYRFFIIIILASLNFLPAKAQVRKYSNDFLNLAGNAAYRGTGNSGISNNTPSDFIFTNATAFRSDGKQWVADFTHASVFNNLQMYDCMSVAYSPDSLTTLGIGLLRVGVDDIQNTLQFISPNGTPDYSRISLFSVADYALGLSYAQNWNKNWRVGGSAKFIYRHIGSFATAWGFGFDAAISYFTPKHSVSLVVSDVLGTYTAWYFNSGILDSALLASGNEIPQNTIEIKAPALNVTYETHFSLNKDFSLTPSVKIILMPFQEYNYLLRTNYISATAHVGAIVGFRNFLEIRAGMAQFQRVKNIDGKEKISTSPSAGLGLKLGRYSIDYAFGNFASHALGSNHIASVSVSF